jgi:hypothetical protein
MQWAVYEASSMKLSYINRRVHLYLALLLLPWMVMYGVSALPFAHASFFEQLNESTSPDWSLRFERPYHQVIPEEADLRQVGAEMLHANGLEGSFGVYRGSAQTINVYLFDFWSATRLTYFFDEGRLRAEDRRFRWDHWLTGMHARGGFQQASWLDDAWAVVVDLACLGLLVWIASGLYMWWEVRHLRAWGLLALGGGLLSFLVFLSAL